MYVNTRTEWRIVRIAEAARAQGWGAIEEVTEPAARRKVACFTLVKNGNEIYAEAINGLLILAEVTTHNSTRKCSLKEVERQLGIAERAGS